MRSIEQRLSILERELNLSNDLFWEETENKHLRNVITKIQELYPSSIVKIRINRASIFNKEKLPFKQKVIAKILNDYYRTTRILIKGIKLTNWKYEFAVV